MKHKEFTFTLVVSTAVFATLLAFPHAARAQAGDDAHLQSEVQHSLDKKQFGGVQVTLQSGVVTLAGQVDTLSDKMAAEKKATKTKHVASVQDNITIATGENVSDMELRAKLSKALVYDRVGYGTTTFNAITLQVQNGVVTLGGMVVEPADKESALSLIENTHGVRELVDNLKIAPLSGNDNRIRLDEARAIYGAAQLNKYAIDPAKPIRIAVDGGHVVLVGTVDSQADRDVAGIRANGVAGVFSVQNDLQVAGQIADR